ncbi:MAG: patatin-like phospholipase family protein [Pseudomonadota bacterium]
MNVLRALGALCAAAPAWCAALPACAQDGAAALAPAPVITAPAAPVSALTTPAPARPRVALVLSGGGARGFAHIGVLRVLHELHVPVDIVVGTSMGSVVGGAFAAGASVSELEKMARETDWDSVVADRPARDDLSFRRREEDLLLPSRIEFGVGRDGVTLPPAAAGNGALELVLSRALPAGTRDQPVNRLALPFRSVASDLLTGELVELADTPLFLTMRASLAVPGVFAPVRVREHLVVDGGLVRNLPVDMARAMGADIVIAVNVGTTLAPEKELHSAVGVAQQMLQILTEQNVQRSLKELRAQDILVAPALAGISFLDFHSYAAAIRAGEQAARALAPRLAALALPATDYALQENRRLAAPALSDVALPLAQLDVKSDGAINPLALGAQSGLVVGKAVTKEQVHQAAASLYGRGDLARVETQVSDEGGKRNVTIHASEAEWANSRLRFGLELASDFDDNNTFALKLMHVRSSLNPWGAELRTVAGIGNVRQFGMQFWQPLGAGSPWYLAPSFELGTSSADLFSAGRRVARVAYGDRGASLVLGRELGNWGDVQLGVSRERSNAQTAIPELAGAAELHSFDTTQFLRYRIDSVDSLAFPSRGNLLDAKWERSPAAPSAGTPSLARSSVLGLSAFHTDNWAGHLYAEWARAQRGTAPLSLGGFLRLSGTAPESISGRSVVLGRMVMARRIGTLPATLGGTVRAGFSLEVGGGYDQDEPLRGSSFRQAGSAFLAVDTRFGPAYFGAGATKGGSSTLYIFLGPIW